LLSCVCLFALYRSQFNRDLHDTSHTGRHQSGEELIKFWVSSAPGSGSRTVLKDSLTLQDRAFCNNFADISQKTSQIFMKILPQTYSWTRTALLHFRTHPDPNSRSGMRIPSANLDSGHRTHSYCFNCSIDLHRVLNIPHTLPLYDISGSGVRIPSAIQNLDSGHGRHAYFCCNCPINLHCVLNIPHTVPPCDRSLDLNFG